MERPALDPACPQLLPPGPPQLAALNNLLKAENNRLRDQALLDATKIKSLQSSLAGEGGRWAAACLGRAGGA